jgi:hypothetical protein
MSNGSKRLKTIASICNLFNYEAASSTSGTNILSFSVGLLVTSAIDYAVVYSFYASGKIRFFVELIFIVLRQVFAALIV